MRVLKEFQYGPFHCSVFHWNGKYLLKLETAWMEQTYKFSETEINSAEEVEALLSETHFTEVEDIFKSMLELHRRLIADSA